VASAPTITPNMPMGQAGETLRVRLRPDLVVRPQFYEGMTHYVVKDPIGLKYYRFKAEEYFLLQQLDGKSTLLEVKKAFERKYRPQTITVDDLVRFCSQLHEAGVAQIDTPEQTEVFVKRRRKKIWKKVRGAAANILYIKIPIIDPERLLTWMYPYFKWIYTRTFVVLSCLLMLSALTMVISNFTEVKERLPDFQSFFNWRTIVYFWCSLAIVKIIHEFGHGLTAKHFGGEVHEMGALLLCLTPALYCDVTDSWLLPNKWHRIWISAAGIYVECVLASLATFAWFYSNPGLFNSLMMATMFLCSMNTIMFNANPLMRYDGYYVLADYLEIPNLRVKANQFFSYAFQEKVLGLEVPVQSYMPRTRRWLFLTYAVSSFLYRWFVTLSILFFLNRLMKPYKVYSIGIFFAMWGMVPLVIMPVYQIVKFVRTPGRLRKVKKVRATAFAVSTVALITAILMIPTPLRIKGTLVVAPENPSRIYANTAGRLVTLAVRDGDMVKKGDLIAQLSNLDKQRERSSMQEELELNRVKAAYFSRSKDLEGRRLARQHSTLADELEPVVARINDQISHLYLVADRDGQVIGVPKRETTGSWIRPDKAFCEIANPKKLQAQVIIDQGDVDLLQTGSKAWVKIYGLSERTYRTEIAEIASRNRDEIPAELSNVGGGEIAAEQDKKTGKIKSVSAVFELLLPLDNEDLSLHVGQRGFAKIDGGTSTLAWFIWRTLSKTFHFAL
jgi:putative peptide zinc metalloprotease protein